jgi:hypothetical protein
VSGRASRQLALLRQFKTTEGLCYTPGTHGGADATLLGIFAIADDPEFRAAIAAAIDPTRLLILPNPRVDPIAELLARNPICNRHELIAKLAQASPAERLAVLESARWNAFHVELAIPHLKLLNATCLEAGISGTFDFSGDGALYHRTREQCYHVRPDPDDRLVPPAPMEGLERELWFQARARERIGKFPLYKNWRSSQVYHRSRSDTSIADGDVVLVLPPLTKRARDWIARAQQFEVEQIELANAAIPARPPGAPRMLPPLRLSAIPPFGGVSEAAYNLLLRVSLADSGHDPGALLTAVTMRCFWSTRHLHETAFVRQGDAHYIGTPVPLLAYDMRHDATIHLPVQEMFWRRVPDELARPFEQLLSSVPHEQLRSAQARFLHAHGCTRTALEYCLRWQVPVWRDVPWLLPEVGLERISVDDGKARAPGYRSYLLYVPRLHEERHVAYLTASGTVVESDPNVGLIPSCGSTHCVRREIAAEMFQTLEMLLLQQLPSTYTEIAALVNAIAALTAFFEILLTYQRNYPASAPAVSFAGEFWLNDPRPVVTEKLRPRPVVYPGVLESLLSRVAMFVYRATTKLERLGFKVTWADEEAGWFAYGFLPMSPCSRTVPLWGRRQRLITQALLHHPATRKFGGLHPNAARNLSYLLLTQDSEFDKDVLELHDHCPDGGAGAFKSRRAEDVAQTALRTRSAEKICAALRQ